MNSFRKHATAMMAVFSVANTVVATAIAQPAQAPVSAPTRPGPMPPRPAPAAPMTAPQIESNPCQAGAGHSAPRCALRYMRETSQRKLTEIVGDGSRPTTLEQMRALDQIVVRLAQAQVASNLTPGFDPAPFLEWWRRNQQDIVLNGVALVVRGAPEAQIGPFFLRLIEDHQEAVEIAARQRPAYMQMLDSVRSTWIVNQIVEPGAYAIGGAVTALVLYLLKTSIQGPIMGTGSVVFSSFFTPLQNYLNHRTSRWFRPVETYLNRMLTRPTGIDRESVNGLVEVMRQQGVEISFDEARTMLSQYRALWTQVHVSFDASSMESVRAGRASGVEALLLRVSHVNGLVNETLSARTTYRIRRHQLIEQVRASIAGDAARVNRFNASLQAMEIEFERVATMNTQTPAADAQAANDAVAQHRVAMIESLGAQGRAVAPVDEIVQMFRNETQSIRQSIAFVAQLQLLDRWYSDVTAGALRGLYREAYTQLRKEMSSIPALEARVLASANEMASRVERMIADGYASRPGAQAIEGVSAPAQAERATGFGARIMRLLPGGRGGAPAQAAGAALLGAPSGAVAGATARQGTPAIESAARAARAATGGR